MVRPSKQEFNLVFFLSHYIVCLNLMKKSSPLVLDWLLIYVYNSLFPTITYQPLSYYRVSWPHWPLTKYTIHVLLVNPSVIIFQCVKFHQADLYSGNFTESPCLCRKGGTTEVSNGKGRELTTAVADLERDHCASHRFV